MGLFIVYNISPYSTIFQLYDGGQLLLVEERTLIHYTVHLGREHRPSASNLTNFLTHSHLSKQDLNRRGLEVRGLMVWNRCLNHSTTEVPANILKTVEIPTLKQYIFVVLVSGSIRCYVGHDHAGWSCPPLNRKCPDISTRGPGATSLTWVILANISPMNTCNVTFLHCH
jgi:hypothetical protein